MRVEDPLIGDRLANYRRLAGLSAQQLSDRTHNRISRAVIANIESGRRDTITVHELLDLSLALGIPPVALAIDLHDPFEDVHYSGSMLVSWFLGDEPEYLNRNRATTVAWSLIQAHRHMRTATRRYEQLKDAGSAADSPEMREQRIRVRAAAQTLRDLGVVYTPYEDDDIIDMADSDG